MSLNRCFAPGRLGLSYELFPPKTARGEENLLEQVGQLLQFAPDFMTCTYGAGGSTQAKTLDVIERVKAKLAEIQATLPEGVSIEPFYDRVEELGVPLFLHPTDAYFLVLNEYYAGNYVGALADFQNCLRGGIKTVLIPQENEKDLADIPKNVLDTLNVYMVQTTDEVLKIALTEPLVGRLPKPEATPVDAPVDDTITH